MCKYFREQMRAEINRLSVLFASFILAYVLRVIFQIGLGSGFYAKHIPDMVTRWYLLNALPIIWDISSFLSILILHNMSFREP